MPANSFIFPAEPEYDPESGETVVSFRDVPGAHTSAPTPGGDRTALYAEAADCLAEAVARTIAYREPLPEPSTPGPDDLMVPLPLRMAAKLALHRECRAHGISQRDLAGRLGCHLREAERLLDTRHDSKIDRLADAVRAVGGPILTLDALMPDEAA